MAQQEQGKVRMGFLNLPVDLMKVPLDQGNTLPVSGMAQKPPPAGIIHRKIRGFAVAPLIRRPNFKTLLNERMGKGVIPEGMLRHAVYDVQDRPGFSLGHPLPQKQLRSVTGFKP
jgi:hypothetical protein